MGQWGAKVVQETRQGKPKEGAVHTPRRSFSSCLFKVSACRLLVCFGPFPLREGTIPPASQPLLPSHISIPLPPPFVLTPSACPWAACHSTYSSTSPLFSSTTPHTSHVLPLPSFRPCPSAFPPARRPSPALDIPPRKKQQTAPAPAPQQQQQRLPPTLETLPSSRRGSERLGW